jgi:hypothetical protein
MFGHGNCDNAAMIRIFAANVRRRPTFSDCGIIVQGKAAATIGRSQQVVRMERSEIREVVMLDRYDLSAADLAR